jgi:hypothetical protein
MQGKLLCVPIVGRPSRVAAQSKDDWIGSLSGECGGSQGDPRKDRKQGEDGVCAYQKHQMSLSRDARRPQASLRRCPTLGQIDEAGAAYRVRNSARCTRTHNSMAAPSPTGIGRNLNYFQSCWSNPVCRDSYTERAA